MFELLFRYPPAVFLRGEFVLRSPWPKWLLLAVIAAAAAGLALPYLLRPRTHLRGVHLGVLWLLQSLTAAVLLILLWEPAIAVSELAPQANIVAVLVDDSRSMALTEGGETRERRVLDALQGVLGQLRRGFQVRLYGFDAAPHRVGSLAELGAAQGAATHIGASLARLDEQTAGLPVGAVILASDGGDNAGTVDHAVIDALRQRRIPVHTVGVGALQVEHDVELEDVALDSRVLAGSRVTASLAITQRGFAGRRTAVAVRAGGRVLATHPILLGADGQLQREELVFDLAAAGPATLQFTVDPLPGEANRGNNTLTRLLDVEAGPRRILYVEGEPRWEYKFIRRALDDDQALQLVSMLRVSENKIYRQGVKDASELADGFPQRPEELFAYDGLIIGSVDAGYFSPAQQALMREFVDRRGGGLLLLGGRRSLADGVWGGSQLAQLLPVVLPPGEGTFHREHATVSLTPAGELSPITRLLDDPAANVARWRTLPYLMDYQDPGTPKPGATVLAQMQAGGRTLPLLITQDYGRGRTAVLATGGTWRWQMSLPLGDTTHARFWQQLLRALAGPTRGRVIAAVSAATLLDDGHVQLSAEVRDVDYLPAADAQVSVHVIGPGGAQAMLDMLAVPGTPGQYQARWTAQLPGVYVAEVRARRGGAAADSDVVSFQRLDGVAENFHTGQNRELLSALAAATGGRYWNVDDLGGLPAAIPYSNAGVSVQQLKDLWNLPAVFIVLLLLRLGEWLLRRRWGAV